MQLACQIGLPARRWRTAAASAIAASTCEAAAVGMVSRWCVVNARWFRCCLEMSLKTNTRSKDAQFVLAIHVATVPTKPA